MTEIAKEGQRESPQTIMFSLTLFLSAGLMFAVQPMLGKMLLPMVGGAPSGWLTALAFFQIGLLGGYWVAHMLSRYPARAQGYATLGLLVLGAVMLPPHLTAGSDSNIGSALQVLTLLLTGISLPYVALSTVSSGLQRLYAAGEKTAGEKPYFLYAASNLGSFAGLLSYPFIVEPSLPLTAQSVVWACGYGLLIVLVGGLLLLPVKKEAAAEISAPAEPALPTPIKLKLKWLVLAFVPSSLSMGLTALITADLGSVPLFWVVPLALYLLTFVIAFGRGWKPDEGGLSSLTLLLIGLMTAVYVLNGGLLAPDWISALLPLAVFFTTALLCHTRLAGLAPDESRLTEFYLWLALGGALGGIFNAFLAPVLFSYPVEFMLVTSASVLLLRKTPPARLARYSNVIAVAAFVFVLIRFGVFGAAGFVTLVAYSVGTLVSFLLLGYFPRQLAITGLLVVVLLISPLLETNRVARGRNFFGVSTIADFHNPEGETWRLFIHGSTVHGLQRVAPEPPDVTPPIYFKPLEEMFHDSRIQDVGVIGLGAGMGLCFKAPGRHFTVYEIDPLVKEMAEKWFTYIKECGEPRWRIGDGRLELQRDAEARYDVLIIDVFSSGSIPTHMLTREALALYGARLKPGGFILYNINNRYYDFHAPLAALARDAGWQAWRHGADQDDIFHGIGASKWVLLAPSDQDLSRFKAMGWHKIRDRNFTIWRDDYTNLLKAMKVMQNDK